MTAQRLPSWAVEPLDMNGAAVAIGVCRRTSIVIIAEHPHYELRGRKKVFYPEHITLIRDARAKSSVTHAGTRHPATTIGE